MDEVLVQPLLPVTVTVYVFAVDKLFVAVRALNLRSKHNLLLQYPLHQYLSQNMLIPWWQCCL